MTVTIPITKTARRFGYIIWNQSHEPDIEKLIESRSHVNLIFGQSDLGVKGIDWKYHRISVGRSSTRGIPDEHSNYKLSYDKKSNTMKVRCI